MELSGEDTLESRVLIDMITYTLGPVGVLTWPSVESLYTMIHYQTKYWRVYSILCLLVNLCDKKRNKVFLWVDYLYYLFKVVNKQ